MNPSRAIRITIAAGMLGVGPKVLLRELRARNILDASNRPAPEYVESDQLSAEWIPIPMGRTGITRHYLTPTVTIKGWPLLELIARDIRHGHNNPEVASPHCSGNSRPAHCLSAEESHQRCAGIMATLGDETRPDNVRAA